MSWIRAVWIEGNQEEEGVVPSNWVKGKILYWPNGINAEKAIKMGREPTDKWRKFQVIKNKCQSDSRTECEEYDLTTSLETDDDSQREGKRERKKKIFRDFVNDESDDKQPDQDKTSPAITEPVVGSSGSKSLPIPPRKLPVMEKSKSLERRVHSKDRLSEIPNRSNQQKSPVVQSRSRSRSKSSSADLDLEGAKSHNRRFRSHTRSRSRSWSNVEKSGAGSRSKSRSVDLERSQPRSKIWSSEQDKCRSQGRDISPCRTTRRFQSRSRSRSRTTNKFMTPVIQSYRDVSRNQPMAFFRSPTSQSREERYSFIRSRSRSRSV
ncbi:arginine/serine-rich coiled-coil protein 2-like isoform X1 [Mizuhopecten yessoensis]|uniref:arginine/serine-rich coiled-coil protein 2-like isoform X1 n=1 Tax=Mizuhopecten yessoensis TaxID=6573 RepID=UPI000B45A2F4|nr:arginine/serine-rich coiled-coil protein 2-like isoform X1 [Mizuhopecten yessoensis]